MTARVLLLVGLVLCALDVAQLRISGIFLLGVVLVLIAFWLFGGFTRSFWVADDETSARLDALDQALKTPAGGPILPQVVPTQEAPGGSLFVVHSKLGDPIVRVETLASAQAWQRILGGPITRVVA